MWIKPQINTCMFNTQSDCLLYVMHSCQLSYMQKQTTSEKSPGMHEGSLTEIYRTLAATMLSPRLLLILLKVTLTTSGCCWLSASANAAAAAAADFRFWNNKSIQKLPIQQARHNASSTLLSKIIQQLSREHYLPMIKITVNFCSVTS